jgi:hypothetical protein
VVTQDRNRRADVRAKPRKTKERGTTMANGNQDNYKARARDLLRTYDSRFETDDQSLISIIAEAMCDVREEMAEEAAESLEGYAKRYPSDAPTNDREVVAMLVHGQAETIRVMGSVIQDNAATMRASTTELAETEGVKGPCGR